MNTLDEAKFEERVIPKKEIIWGDWEVVMPATYEATGLERRVNTLDEAKFEDREIPIRQIVWGEWKAVTPATYEATGLERRVNTLDEAKFEEREIPKKEIIWGEWQLVRQATCTQEGLEERVALEDASYKQTRALPTAPHQPNNTWFVTKFPDFETEGMKILRCKVGGEILKTEKIPVQALPSWSRGSLRVTDTSGTDGAPRISLAKERSRVLSLVDDGGTIMGKLVVLVQKGQVTFTYEIFPPFTATGGNLSLSDPQRGTMALPFNKPFSIARDLGGQTHFDLYVSLQAENPQALAELTSPSPPVQPPMAFIPNAPTPTFGGDIRIATGRGDEVNNVNMDDLTAFQTLMENTAEAQNDAAAQAKVQDMMAKAQNLLTQADSMDEAARKRSIDAILSAAIQINASIPQSTGTGSEQVNKAGQDASTPAWNDKDMMQAQINLEQEGTQDSNAKIDERIKDIIKYLSDLTNTQRTWEKTLK